MMTADQEQVQMARRETPEFDFDQRDDTMPATCMRPGRSRRTGIGHRPAATITATGVGGVGFADAGAVRFLRRAVLVRL